MNLISLEFLALIVAALWAATAPAKLSLRLYFISSLVSSCALFLVSMLGYGIASPEYASTYTVFRLVIMAAAIGYVASEVTVRWYLLVPILVSVELFLYTVLPINRYYQWISASKGIVFAALGITLFALSRTRANRILASLWILQSVDAYGFTKNTDLWWWLNKWEPSAVTIAFYAWLGAELRLSGRTATAPSQ